MMAEMFPDLQTKRLKLREMVREDIPALCQHLNNYEVSKMLSVVPYPYSKMDAESWLAHDQHCDLSDEINWVIDNGAGQIGSVGLRLIKTQPTIGYWLAEPYWGKGYMSEVVRAVLNYAFDELALEQIHVSAFNENSASLKLLRKQGFRSVGSEMTRCAARGDEDIPHILLELPRHDYFEENLDRLTN